MPDFVGPRSHEDWPKPTGSDEELFL
jgi:hypothetical protein